MKLVTDMKLAKNVRFELIMKIAETPKGQGIIAYVERCIDAAVKDSRFVARIDCIDLDDRHTDFVSALLNSLGYTTHWSGGVVYANFAVDAKYSKTPPSFSSI